MFLLSFCFLRIVKASKQTSEQQQQMKDSPQFQPSHFTIQFHAESVCYYILHSKQAAEAAEALKA